MQASNDEIPPYEVRGKISDELRGQISDELRGQILDYNPEALLADGFEEAIVGMAERCSRPALVVYDAEKCVEILMKRDGMTEDEAFEFFSFNTLGAWVGENTPLFLWKF